MNVKTYDTHWQERETESFREVVIETPTERIVVKEYNGKLSTSGVAGQFYSGPSRG